MINRQQIYNTVRDHLLSQGQRALEVVGRSGMTAIACKYRIVKNGQILKCAIGCLIDDVYYSELLEGRTIRSESVQGAVAASIGVALKEIYAEHSFLGGLQRIHDNTPLYLWKQELVNLADRYNLQP